MRIQKTSKHIRNNQKWIRQIEQLAINLFRGHRPSSIKAITSASSFRLKASGSKLGAKTKITKARVKSKKTKPKARKRIGKKTF